MDILQDIFPHVFDMRIGTFVMQYDSVSCCEKSPQEFFADPLIYLTFPTSSTWLSEFLSCVLTSSFFSKNEISVLLSSFNPWPSTLEAKVPMAEDFHGSADLLFAHCSESVHIAGAQWLKPRRRVGWRMRPRFRGSVVSMIGKWPKG